MRQSMGMKCPSRILRSALVLAIMTAMMSAAAAQSVQDFYKGKQISLLVISATGGNGIYAGVLSHFMPKYIPGNPTIVLREMPAAAGLALLNHLYSVAPKDGLTLGTVDRGTLLEPLLGNENARFDASKMTSIASIGKQLVVCSIGAQSKIKSIQQAFQQEVLVGALSTHDILDVYPALLNAVLHTKFKVISGYDSTQAIWLAIERGELDGVCGAWSTLKSDKPDWLSEKKIMPLLQVSFTGSLELKDVPKLTDFPMSEPQREMLDFYASLDDLGRPYLAPPGIPEDRRNALRHAFDATMQDQDFQNDAKKANLDIDPIDGEEMEARLQATYAMPPDILRRIIEIRQSRE